MNADRLEEILMSPEQREGFLGRMRAQVNVEDYRWIETFCQIAVTLDRDNLSKLRHLLFGRKTQTTDQVCPPAASTGGQRTRPRAAKGHGRCPAAGLHRCALDSRGSSFPAPRPALSHQRT